LSSKNCSELDPTDASSESVASEKKVAVKQIIFDNMLIPSPNHNIAHTIFKEKFKRDLFGGQDCNSSFKKMLGVIKQNTSKPEFWNDGADFINHPYCKYFKWELKAKAFASFRI